MDPGTNVYLRAKLKMSIFENGQVSGHLIFDETIVFWGEEKFFTSINKNFVFFENCFSKKQQNKISQVFYGLKSFDILKKHFQKI